MVVANGAAMDLRHLALLVPMSLVACSGGVADPEPPAGAPAASESPPPASAPTPPAPPPTKGPAPSLGIVGAFHHAKLAATNLALRDDNTFTWTTEKECGEAHGQCGTWKVSPNGGVELSAVGGLRWIETGEPMKSVVVQETREGVAVTGVTLDGVTLRASWDLGRMCPVCRGGPGPATEAKCETPLPDVCG